MKQSQAEPLGKYARLIERYHRTLDLMSDSAVADLDRMLADSVRYAELVAGLAPAEGSIVDLGSGVGLPGIPIAVRLPSRRVTLVERRRRRVSFLRIAVSQLRLDNASIHHGDVQSMRSPCADVVVAQAVGTFAEVHRLTRHLQGERIWLVSRKGGSWREEVAELEAEIGATAAECREEPLSLHGTLVAVLVPGGSACPPSG